MTVQSFNNGIDVKKIHHISDIQIRLIKRHKEYRQVFSRLYEQLRKNSDSSIIVVSGDIVHTKTELSPELVDMTQDFFNELAKITHTIVMPGNHDCNLNNTDRMDSLSPIVKGVNNPNLYYIKNSCAFQFNNLQLSVMGVFEDKSQYVSADKLPSGLKVAIFHGTVNNSVTDLGHTFLTSDIDIDFFDGFDMVLLGDIHKMQCLQKRDKKNNKPEIWYAGSLVQQNHGESLSHGYLTWDVQSCTPAFREVKNDYGYYTIEIKDGNPSDYSNIPAKPRLRVQVWNTDGGDVKRILADVRKTADVQEVVVNRIDTGTSKVTGLSNLSSLDIRNVEIQTDLIIKYLEQKYTIANEMVERIKKINADANGKLTQREVLSNLTWKAENFTFNNMFSYGEGNRINFSSMNGTVGIFAPNASGKSAILDALSFNIFDKSARAYKASQILNSKKDDFACQLDFSISDVMYHISRKASKRKYTNQIKVDVDFWYENEFGEKVSLNGDERRGTDESIGSYIGTYEDFVLTAMSVQGNNTGFIDMGQSERKDLLSRFLGLNVLEELYMIASEESKEIQTLLKDFQRQDFSSQLAQAEIDREVNKRQFLEHSNRKKVLSSQREVLNGKIVELAKELIQIDSSILDIDTLTKNLSKEKTVLSDTETALEDLMFRTRMNDTGYNLLQNELSMYDETEIKTKYDELQRLEHEHEDTDNQIERVKVDVQHKLDKLKKLAEHKYDPKCVFCMNNVFVKDAILTQQQLDQDKELFSILVEKLKALKLNIGGLQQYRSLYAAWSAAASALDSVKMQRLEINAEISACERKKNTTEMQIVSLQEKINKHMEMKDAVEKNKTTEKEIDRLQLLLTDLVSEIDTLDTKLRTSHGKIKVAETTIKSITESIEHAKDLEEEYSAYEYYLDAVKRDGVAYDLISETIPEIEREVNNILNQIADFSIVWNLDGKSINTYIAYDENTFWPLELISGMEKFISSLAIRVALINVSSLPRPNFLAIDEGFGVLDSENINSIHLLLDYLKNQFQFVLIISHLDQMKDVVDTVVEIKKDDGFSVVQFD